MLLQVGLHHAGVLLINMGQNLVNPLDNGYFEPAMNQVFRHFQANKSAANDHCPGFWPHGLESRILVHAGEKRAALFYPLPDFPGVRHGPHVKNARKVYSRQGRCTDAAPGDSTSLS